jgi:hypothetical protein
MSFMPAGLQFQACWCRDRWILTSKSFAYINDQRAEGCELTTIELLDHHLRLFDVGIEQMEKSRIYTFLLARKEFNKWIPVQD